MSELMKNSSVERLDSQKSGRYEGQKNKNKKCEFMFNIFPAGLIHPHPTSPPAPAPPSNKSFFNKPLLFLEELTDLLLLESQQHWEGARLPLPFLPKRPAASGKPRSFPPECAVS